ncbi:hypothetical protein H5410_012589 [Solanum commersonii]|uniref:MADS-box domain-containing protein n=1 Tax=Solanum commersonii TaxID=4109 RepID=A0A9J6ASV6_SOLCO|nr:hypothetical protein H5410_012589 [Solanum commersonii]
MDNNLNGSFGLPQSPSFSQLTKVKFAFIENNTKRRVSYRKREKGFLTKARELNTLCNVELATIVNSPYNNEPEMFPNHEATTDIFTKFIDLSEEDKSKNMKTQENIITKRIEKFENELEKVRKENKKTEYTNQMYGLLNGEEMPNSMHLEALNDLCYVINKNLKLMDDMIEAKTHEEGFTLNAPQLTVGPMDSVLSEIPLLVPSTVPSGTNFERPRPPLLVPNVTPTSMVPLMAPLMGPSSAPTQVTQFMFPLRTPPQMVQFVDLSQIPSSSSSQRYPEMAYTMDYPMSSSMLVLPMAP